jgi:hypothetical protein
MQMVVGGGGWGGVYTDQTLDRDVTGLDFYTFIHVWFGMSTEIEKELTRIPSLAAQDRLGGTACPLELPSPAVQPPPSPPLFPVRQGREVEPAHFSIFYLLSGHFCVECWGGETRLKI